MCIRDRDATGSIELVWFKGARWLQMSLKPGQEYIVFGKPNHFNGRYSIPHPEMELTAGVDPALQAALQPVYSTTEKLTAKGLVSRALGKLTKAALLQGEGSIPETLDQHLIDLAIDNLQPTPHEVTYHETTRSQGTEASHHHLGRA